MKKLLAAIAILAVAVTTYGQGRVNFSNGSTTAITTNNLAGTTGQISGAGNFYFGLYMGPSGSTEGSLQLVILATNTALAGRLSGGNPAPLPGGYGDGSIATPLVYQIRGWSSFAGLSYEAAQSYNGSAGVAYTGKSALGSVTPTTSPTAAAVLFGTGAGNVGGFELAPPVPEPSSIALGLLGLGAVALIRRRK